MNVIVYLLIVIIFLIMLVLLSLYILIIGKNKLSIKVINDDITNKLKEEADKLKIDLRKSKWGNDKMLMKNNFLNKKIEILDAYELKHSNIKYNPIFKSKRAIIVNNDADIIISIRSVLLSLGIEVDYVLNIDDAIKAIGDNGHYDLAFIDASYEYDIINNFLKIIRSDYEDGDLIILLTGNIKNITKIDNKYNVHIEDKISQKKLIGLLKVYFKVL